MAYPQIVYNPGNGDVVLAFTYPPVNKPGADDREAIRHDTLTSSGLRQSVLERTDIFKNLQLDFVPLEDMPQWSAFIDYAIAGGSFIYFPDADQTDNNTYLLEDTNWKPKLAMKGFAKFTLQMRFVS